MWRQEYDEANRILKFAKDKAREEGSGYAIVGAHFFHSIALGNQGRLGEAMESVTEGRRLAELIQEKYWLSRLPNTVAWLHRELGDPENPHLPNLENLQLAQEFGMPEGEANAHVNLAIDYMDLGEPARAELAAQLGDARAADECRARARATIRSLADSVADDALRARFLKSPGVTPVWARRLTRLSTTEASPRTPVLWSDLDAALRVCAHTADAALRARGLEEPECPFPGTPGRFRHLEELHPLGRANAAAPRRSARGDRAFRRSCIDRLRVK